MSFRFSSLSAFAFVGLAFGCSSPAPQEEQSESAPLLSDVLSMVQLPGGDFRVSCRNGTTEVRTEAAILANHVCQPSGPLGCVRRCVARAWNGACSTYGSDYCATGTPQCQSYCSARAWIPQARSTLAST